MDPLPDWPRLDDLTGAPESVLRHAIEHADALLHLASEFDPHDGGPLSTRCAEVLAIMSRVRADCLRELARQATKRAAPSAQPGARCTAP